MKKKHIARRVLIFLTLGAIGLTVLHPTLPDKAGATAEETQTTEEAGQLLQAMTWEETTHPDLSEIKIIPESIYHEDVILLGRTIWGEAEGVQSKTEQAAVAWCILNRVDATGQTIEEVVTAPEQFHGYYRVGEDVPREFLVLAGDVLSRWNAEKQGNENVGRVLPADYLYFIGDGARNYFSKEWQSSDYWGWTLKSPY